MPSDLSALAADLDRIVNHRRCGRVVSVGTAALEVAGLTHQARLGDAVTIDVDGGRLTGEVVALAERYARVMTYGPSEGAAVGNRVTLERRDGAHPGAHWVGRIVDAFGAPLDGRPLAPGAVSAPLRRAPPEPASRKRLGPRLGTGLAVFDTILPLARGQRIGIFAGSGVGKSSLLADLARGVEADVVVFGLIGERGRELRHFVEDVLGDGMARAVVIAATSDQSPLVKRRAAWMAMATAEVFRDEGRHVLLLLDSLTRFAEAHREVALTAGEAPSLRAFPPSTANLIAGLCERAGPGPAGAATSPASSRCWSRARTWRSRSPTSPAACSTAMWCSTAPSPSAAAFRRSTCAARSPAACRRSRARPRTTSSPPCAGCSPPTRTPP
jgi:flagellum-specific ATP synthase